MLDIFSAGINSHRDLLSERVSKRLIFQEREGELEEQGKE